MHPCSFQCCVYADRGDSQVVSEVALRAPESYLFKLIDHLIFSELFLGAGSQEHFF